MNLDFVINNLSADVLQQVLVAEAWTPVSARDRVQDALRSVSDSSSSTV